MLVTGFKFDATTLQEMPMPRNIGQWSVAMANEELASLSMPPMRPQDLMRQTAASETNLTNSAKTQARPNLRAQF